MQGGFLQFCACFARLNQLSFHSIKQGVFPSGERTNSTPFRLITNGLPLKKKGFE